MAFSGKRVLVTGSSRGIGQAVARQFFQSGAQVAVNGRTPDSTAAGMAALGDSDRLVAAPGDVSSVAGCEAVVAAAVEGLGGLDILVNSAGVAFFLPLEDSDEAVWDATLDTNLKGTFFCMRAAAGPLRDSGGNIVNVASDAGLIGEKGLSVYCASKGGVVNLTRAMALELAPTVRVNCVCPGYVDTDMVRRDGIDQADDPQAAEQAIVDYAPLKRISKPAEIAKAIAYLAGEDALFITGSALQIDGGSTAGH
ncbi:MAG: glucose 1-dehydrogenase [Arenicellales bacterium]|nr:bacilysin biosynthesis oxidoreductase BacC [Acidiferrobacteraceae bacterium]MDP6135194.1 glucose 1-dehydrogenase [Arenicellales bacterium]MDP6392448.1 glucose 1-dehydrogenase [Arenicellales bacterium]|tara:strand:+ start:214 stop:972 length:759 start_codon:yes stop_codon:yes gene_type:complete